MSTRHLLMVAVIVLAIIASMAVAAPGWLLLGSAKFAPEKESRGVVTVTLKQPFSTIRMRVDRAPAHIGRVMITFGNGRTQEVALDRTFRQGTWTRPINLRGRERHIQTIELWAQSASRGGVDSWVVVFGR